ncbi:MAG: ABC transporter permease [Patescibacteria group bacterium]
MNKIFSTFLLSFKSVFRNLKSSAIVFVLPVVFMSVFGLAFGGENNVRFSLGIYQLDKSEFELSRIFQELSDEDNNIELTISDYNDRESLKKDVEIGNQSIGVLLLDNVQSSPEFEILLPQNNAASQVNSSIVLDTINRAFFAKDNININVINPSKENMTGFDFLAPGLIIYGLIILIPSIAQSFSQINEKNYIFRYTFSKISALEIILGNVLFYFIIGIVQAIILYYVAIMFGYQTTGNLGLAILPILLTLFFVIAVGLLISAVVSKSEAATNLGTIISIILGFFSGSFISGIGNILEFDILGRNVQFNDFLPTKWGTVAVDKILKDDLALIDIQTELWILSFLGLIVLALSIWIYANRQLKYQS